MSSLGRLRAAALLAVPALTLAACGGSGDSKKSPDAAAPPGVVNVSFWHGMNGTNGEALTALTDKFNAAHDGKIKVTAVYQGTYDDTIAKLKASLQSKDSPNLAQIYDIGTKFMVDSKATTPVQNFIKNDKTFDANDLQKPITNYYSPTGTSLASMPFNSSMPLLYINKEAFTKAGLDPNKPPATLDEIRAAAEKLTIKDAGGKVVQYGFGAALYGWFLEQFTAETGNEYCNQSNGHAGNADQVLINKTPVANVVDWWAKMVKDGYAVNTGRNTTDAQNSFKAGRAAITLESTGQLKSFQAASQGKFTVGTGFFPTETASDDRSKGGPIIGGASLWIMNGHPTYQQQAAWEYVKFLLEPEQMAFWHTHTGYFPTSKKALELPDDVAWRQQYPGFQTAIDQLAKTPSTTATKGCSMGVMPQVRAASEVGLEKAVLGKGAPQAAMDEAATSLQPVISAYNAAVGK